MIKRFAILILSLTILVTMSACGNRQDEALKGIQWQEYSSLGQDFSLSVPADWEMAEESLAHVELNLPTGDGYFTVVLDRGIGSYTLPDYADP
jgi:hypothetical protein